MNHGLKIGDMTVYTLQDAQFYLPSSLLTDIDHAAAVQLIGSDSSFTPANAYLVRTPDHTILIDAGVGNAPGEDAGHLLEQLHNAGVTPDKIDLIFITHFHMDHIGGLTSHDGKRIFPHATIYASQAESNFWLGDTSSMPPALRQRSSVVRSVFAPYQSAGAYRTFLPSDSLGSGIKAYAAYGHTPGHTVYTFSSQGKEFWCIGDLIHFGKVQFSHPTAAVSFDSDRNAAIASRVEFFKRAAKLQAILAGAHLPALVQLEEKNDGFIATPVDTH